MIIDMPTIELYRANNKIPRIDITNICESVILSADISECARKCEVITIYSLNDRNHEKVFPALGDIVTVKFKNKILFMGMIMERGLGDDEKSTFTCYDQIIHLLKSKGTYNLKNVTVKNVAEKMANEVGMKIGYLYPNATKFSFIAKEKSLYEILMTAYTKLSNKTGMMFIPIMVNGNQLSVIEKGFLATNKVLSLESNITSWNYKDDINDMVNRVKIYDENSKFLGMVENATLIKLFGLFQDIVTKSDDADPNAEAKSRIKGVTQEFTVECIGMPELITGYGVRVQMRHLDITRNQNMYIESDTHTFDYTSRTHMMSLNLTFANTMDKQEADDE